MEIKRSIELIIYHLPYCIVIMDILDVRMYVHRDFKNLLKFSGRKDGATIALNKIYYTEQFNINVVSCEAFT